MARDMGGLVLATKAVLSQEHCKLSPLLPPVPFRNEVKTEKQLKFIILLNVCFQRMKNVS